MSRHPAPWRPTGRGLGVAAMAALSAGIGGWFGSPALLVLAAGLATAVVAAAATLVVETAGLQLTVSSWAAPTLVAAGSRSAVEVVATATGTGALHLDRAQGRWQDRTARGGSADTERPRPGWPAPPVHRLDPMAGGRDRPWRCTSMVPTGERGTVALPARRIWVHDPLGLFAAAVAVAPPVTVVVHPAPAAAAVDPVGARRTNSATTGGTDGSSRAPAGGGELAGVRPYATGDRLHLVHWPSLARPGPVLVKELAPDVTDAVCVVVDDRADVHPPQTFEAMLQVTCGLVLGAWHAGSDVVLATCSGRRTVVPQASGAVAGALELLAGLVPSGRVALAPQGPATTVTSTAAAVSLPAGFAAAGPVVPVA